MWYYVTLDKTVIGVYNSVEEVNHFIARKGYTIIGTIQAHENETLVIVEKWN